MFWRVDDGRMNGRDLRRLIFVEGMMIAELSVLDTDEPYALTPTIPDLPQWNTTLLTHRSTFLLDSLLTQHLSRPTSPLMIFCISLHRDISLHPLFVHSLSAGTSHILLSILHHQISTINHRTGIAPHLNNHTSTQSLSLQSFSAPSSCLILPQPRPCTRTLIADSLSLLSVSPLHSQTITTLMSLPYLNSF